MLGLSDRRLLAYCLLASVVAFGIWVAVLRPRSGGWLLPIAIAALAVLSFLDGLVRGSSTPE